MEITMSSSNQHYPTFEVDNNTVSNLLVELNTVFLEEVAVNLVQTANHLGNATLQEFIQHSIGIDAVIADHAYGDYKNISEMAWHIAFPDDKSRQSFTESIRENILEEFIWTEFENIGIEVPFTDGDTTEQLVDVSSEASNSIAEEYMTLLETSQCNPPLDKFREEIAEALRKAYISLENYAWKAIQAKMQETVPV